VSLLQEWTFFSIKFNWFVTLKETKNFLLPDMSSSSSSLIPEKAGTGNSRMSSLGEVPGQISRIFFGNNQEQQYQE
jgi:hypothetical protein